MELFEKSMTILSDLFKRDFQFSLATVKEIESNSNVALFNFFPTHYFIRWGLIALLSPLCILPKNKYQCLKVSIFTILTSVFLSKFNLLSYTIGGL